MPTHPSPRAALIAASALALAAGARAQDVGEYKLPPAPIPTTRPAGPVIPEAPVVRSADPRPEPSASPSPTASADPATETPETPASRPAPARAAAPNRRATATATTGPVTPAAAESDAVVSLAPTGPTEPAAAEPAASAPPPAPVTATPGESGWPLWWHALGGFGVIALPALFLLGRRRKRAFEPGDDPLIAARSANPPTPTPTRVTPPGPLVTPPDPTAQPSPPARSAGPAPLVLAFEAQKLSLSFMNARLTYRLALTNAGAAPTGPLQVAGDMISAHASRDRGAQLQPALAAMPVLHRVAQLAPQESIELDGEIVLPLSDVQALTSGRAVMLVPLVRLHVGAQGGSGETRVFVVGEPGAAGGRVQPIRLDLGPRPITPLAQAEIKTR